MYFFEHRTDVDIYFIKEQLLNSYSIELTQGWIDVTSGLKGNFSVAHNHFELYMIEAAID